MLRQLIRCHYNYRYWFLRPSHKQVSDRYMLRFQPRRSSGTGQPPPPAPPPALPALPATAARAPAPAAAQAVGDTARAVAAAILAAGGDPTAARQLQQQKRWRRHTHARNRSVCTTVRLYCTMSFEIVSGFECVVSHSLRLSNADFVLKLIRNC